MTNCEQFASGQKALLIGCGLGNNAAALPLNVRSSSYGENCKVLPPPNKD
ncbi:MULTISPECIES: hypothetical protein [Nostoc]|uniref:Uncharacterized protein n=2 Tax=Nostoc TaxID=1177 RepID=A0ABR8IBF3_9NOSO|nr:MULTISPECIES: hypothetical protein [Nostoc]MBD2563052.1 hypothetical protein [Nostoc linckia FACHB-391]MBD2648137.1 hypothetical protein [Nostoc foliaceum FACHB-393]